LEPEKVLKPNVSKSLLKATLAMAVLTPFLTLNWSTLPSYILFLGVYYLMVGLYMLNKEATVYRFESSGIHVSRPWREETVIQYDNILGIGVGQGMLARRFHCGTLYVELKKGKGTHRSVAGVGVVPLKDIPDPERVYKEISDATGVFGASTAPEPDPQTGST
jgi:hypothetical protein